MASLNDISKEVRLEKQKRNRRIALIIGGVFLVIAVIAIALYIAEAIRTKTYTSYDVISKSYFLIENVCYLMKTKKVRTEQNDFRSVRKKKLFSYSLQYAAAVLAVRAALL